MTIITLLENHKLKEKYKSAHGLSFYIEVDNQKILFDLGPAKYFEKNAKHLGVDLKDIDYLVLSHGHFDHTGGLKRFFEINKKAKIYASKDLFLKTYKSIGFLKIYIGTNQNLPKDRFIFVEDDIVINDYLTIATNVEYKDHPISDHSLMVKKDGVLEEDKFDHEIYLIAKENDKKVLFSGCSHKGIYNIIDSLEKRFDIEFDHVIGGFHLSHYDENNEIHNDYIKQLSEELMNKTVKKYYSCHCTGDLAFNKLKLEMKQKITKIMTGSIINI